MAFSTPCPSCGAPVVFKSATSVLAVCEYCSSTLVRHDQALEDVGKMAALVEDRSPLQLGSEGRYRGVHFALIGRIQIRYEQGGWNEWHVLFDDMRTAWLSDAGGEYVLTFVAPLTEQVPTFDELLPGRRFVLGGQTWTVGNRERGECIAGQGELPFVVGAGYPVAVADLRNGRHFATLDYSGAPPTYYVGEVVDFPALAMRGLRDSAVLPERQVQARVFRCPSCGSPLQARSPDILAVGCPACGAVIDTADQTCKLLSKALDNRGERYKPLLPLGSKGRLERGALEVIGFMVRQCRVEGILYAWREYLLAGENGRYRWLTESNGHWNLVDVLSDPPSVGSSVEAADVQWQDERFRHFSTTPKAEVVQVAGEFTWRVRVGETCRATDYVAPPRMLSRESTDKEVVWSLGRYIDAARIAEAFRLPPLPAPVGVHACQPNPWAETHATTCRRFWKFLLLALGLQLLFSLFLGQRLLLRQDFVFSPERAGETQVTREFKVGRRSGKLTVRNATSLDNNWIGLDLTLVDKATGAAWPAAREVAYYAGYDGGESWSEGGRNDEVVFLDIPPGTYYLAVDPEISPEKPVVVQDRIEVSSGGAGWANFVLLVCFLAIFPVFSRARHEAFEGRRWSESDHPPADED